MIRHSATDGPSTWVRLIHLAASVLFGALALAQGPTGVITGLVSDTSGGMIPNATVRLMNPATGAPRRVATNQEGVFSFPSLPPGVYTITVEAAGFQAQSRANVEIQVQQTARVDFTVHPGTVSEVLDVVAAPPQLATEDATLGQVIENRRILDLPLNGRNYLDLTALSPGVNTNSAPTQAASLQGGPRSQQVVVVNGQRPQYAHFTLDGLENTDPNINSYILLPSIDALQEFKVQSATYPAEFGFGISQINVSTKSGTNAFHGTMYEFLRNAQLDAKNFFDRGNEPIPPFRRNQFGATGGGPLVKNKLFFFGNYEGLRESKALTQVSTVPLPALRSGDFTSLAVIYDPLTRVTGADGKTIALPFPNNHIDKSRFDARSLKMLEFLPAPNLPGTTGNFINNEARLSRFDQFMVRTDYNQNEKWLWYARYNYSNEDLTQPSTFPDQGYLIGTKPHQLLLGGTQVLTASMVNDVRVGITRFRNNNVGIYAFKQNIAQESGIPNLITNVPEFYGIPAFSLTGFDAWGQSGSAFVTNDPIFEVQENLTWVRGRHSWKFGGTLKPIHYNEYGNQFPRGRFEFDGSATKNPASTARGEPFADYLLGVVYRSSTTMSVAEGRFRTTYWAGYLADSVRLTPKLTLDYGLRFERITPFRDIHDGTSNLASFDRDSAVLVRSSQSGTDPYDGIPVRFPGVTVLRDGSLGPGLYHATDNNWAPRLGLAYSLDQKTVVRVGYGIFYDMVDVTNKIFDMTRTLAGYVQQITDPATLDLTLASPFRFQAGPGVLQVPVPFVTANDVGQRNSYVEQWSFEVQRSIRPDFMMSVAYVGSQGHGLGRLTSRNTPEPGPGAVDPRRPSKVIGQVQLPMTIGNSNYNGLQVRLEQRFRHGLTVLSSYTFSKSIDDTSGVRVGGDSGEKLMPGNVACANSCERGLSGFDARHRWVTSALYELPIGRKRDNPFLSLLLAGWQVGGIFTLQSGLPLNPGISIDQANNGVRTQRPNATGISPILPRDQQSPNRFFNTAAFALQPLYTFGNAGRNSFPGPGLISLNGSLIKRFGITEGTRLEFRAEFFNLPNHPLFGGPDMNLNSPTFGRILSTRADNRQIQFGLKVVF